MLVLKPIEKQRLGVPSVFIHYIDVNVAFSGLAQQPIFPASIARDYLSVILVHSSFTCHYEGFSLSSPFINEETKRLDTR